MRSSATAASSGGGGFFGKLLGAGKRLVTGESLFTTVYTNKAPPASASVAFGAPYPGKIIAMDLRQLGGMLICQKDSASCARPAACRWASHFQQKLSVGFFGGEGFIMQKLEGDGLAFVHAGGTVVKRELQPRADPDGGHRLPGGATRRRRDFEIQYVGKIKTALFGGEGLFFAGAHRPRHGVAAEPAVLAPGLAHLRGGAAAGGGREEGLHAGWTRRHPGWRRRLNAPGEGDPRWLQAFALRAGPAPRERGPSPCAAMSILLTFGSGPPASAGAKCLIH
jgi:uncharacterized protein (AIM24 family)